MTKWTKVEYGEGTIEALAEMGIDVEKEVNRALAEDHKIQLVEQAGCMMGDESEEFITRLEKFVELIIKEIENMYVSGESDTSDVFNFLLDVKKHFGVE